MLIRCKIKRKAGTNTTIDGTTYSFTPDAHGEHVCEVTNEAHIQRLLLIPEGYEPYGDESRAEAAAIVTRENALDADEERIIVVPLDLQNATYEELSAEYRREFGRAANPVMKHETLLKKLIAHRIKKATPAPAPTQPSAEQGASAPQ